MKGLPHSTHRFTSADSARAFSSTASCGNTAQRNHLQQREAEIVCVHTSSNRIRYNITYNLDSGTVATANPPSYTVENAITLNNPTREGYTFAGWTGTGLNSTTETVTIAAGSTGDRSYTAHWTAHTYTISYIENKPLDATGTVTGVPDNQSKTHGETLVLSGTAPVLAGYTFLGWAVNSDAPASYQPGGAYTENAPQTFYARWQANTYLDYDDVYQQLAERLIRAVRTFNPDKGDFVKYIFHQLHYELLNMKTPRALYGITKAPNEFRGSDHVSLNALYDDGESYAAVEAA